MELSHLKAFLLALGLGLAFLPMALITASRLNVVAITDFRRKKATGIPLWGGFAVFLSPLIGAFFFAPSSSLFLVLCGLPLILSGVIDDLKELGSRPKFLAQVLTVTLFLTFREPGTLILEQVGMATWLANLLVGFWMIGMINAVNFIDGMDGVAGSVTLIAALTLAFMNQHSELAYFGMLLAGASLAFLFFNRPPAKIYLGDAGSTFIGFSLAALAAMTPMRHVHPLWVAAPMFVVAYPQADAVLAILRRWRIGISLFKGDHDHIHHLLQKVGFSVRQSLLIISGVGIYCAISALFLFYTSNIRFALALLFLTISALCAVLTSVYFLRLRLAQQVSNYSQSLIHQHFQISPQIFYDPDHFQAAVFDLLPYYKELQQRGVMVVHRFISTFSRVVEKRCPEAQVKTLGSYSIILIFSGSDQKQNDELRRQLIQDFYSLLESFEIVRNLAEVPEGMEFFSQEEKAHEFHQLLRREKRAPLRTAA